MKNDRAKKNIRSILDWVAFLGIFLGLFLWWQYKKGVIEKRYVAIWCFTFFAVVSLCNVGFSIFFKETALRGASFTKEKSPFLYLLGVFIHFFLFLFCLIGIIYYSSTR